MSMNSNRIGRNLAGQRKRLGLSLEALAVLLEVEEGLLKGIEEGRVDPEVSLLVRLACALETDITALLHPEREDRRATVLSRAGERPVARRGELMSYESLSPGHPNGHIEPFMLRVSDRVPPTGQASSHEGEEFHYVIEGRLKVILEEHEYILGPGDSIYFDSSRPHQLHALGGPARVMAVLYNSQAMLRYIRNRRMADLVLQAKKLGGSDLSVVCPDDTVIRAVNRGMQENVINNAWLVGRRDAVESRLIRYPERIHWVDVPGGDDYQPMAARRGVELVTRGRCQLLMKGQINTAVFVKAVLQKEGGLRTDKRLSLVGIFELPGIDRLVFLTDPGINPVLVTGNDLETSRDIIENGIDVARGLGVTHPRVALLEANEKTSEKIPVTMYQKELSRREWRGATVSGPLSYDLALYPEAVEAKGLSGDPVAGRADVLVVPYIAGGNFLYKAWAKTVNADLATIVAGARVPLILTSRSDGERTKFLTLCTGSVYAHHLRKRDAGK